MCFSAINGSGSAYLSELLLVYTPSRTRRSSSDTRILKIQQYKCKTHGFRTFACFGPHIWNSLPQDLRHCSTLSSFKAFENLPLLTVFSPQLISIPSFCFSHKPVLNWANVCSTNILRTVRRTMIRFLIELLVHRTWFGQSKLYFVLIWLVMTCKLRPELAADAQQTA